MWDGPPQPVILTLSAAEGGSAQLKDPDALDIPSAARTILPTEPVRAKNPRICLCLSFRSAAEESASVLTFACHSDAIETGIIPLTQGGAQREDYGHGRSITNEGYYPQ
jgi:hypothetical protein